MTFWQWTWIVIRFIVSLTLFWRAFDKAEENEAGAAFFFLIVAVIMSWGAWHDVRTGI